MAVNFRVTSPLLFLLDCLGFGRPREARMDATSAWLHNINIDRTLNRLGTYIDPSKRATLLKFLVEEEDRLGTEPDQLEPAARNALRSSSSIRTVIYVADQFRTSDPEQRASS
jgi:hypothetical protein